VTALVQPVLKPSTWGEYLAVRERMIDTHGRPLVIAHCDQCSSSHFTVEPCLSDVACPDCGSTAARCQRPSGHEAAAWHASRINELERITAQREAHGAPAVAPWPASAPTLF
jgi:hypothetical protein